MKTIVEKSKKLTNLLEELEESIFYEKCKYHLIKDDSFGMIVYMLIDIKTKGLLKAGKAEHIKTFITLRKIDTSLIFMGKNVALKFTKMNYDDWKTETPPDLPLGECGYCGEACNAEFCSSDCKKAYISEN